jgi:4-hydroxy-tetrahydrodipicolinate synthase
MLTRENFIGPWAGIPVAWDEHLEFDEAVCRADVAACCQAGIPGIYTGGSTGEFYAMDFSEFQAVARATVDECRAHGTPCMIGCTSTYTKGAVRRVELARSLGADAIQVALPFWTEVPDSQVIPFFQEVGAAAGDMAVCIYETTRSKKSLTLEQHQAIKNAVPRYTMVKANASTVGYEREGCRTLSEFVNVFVHEGRFHELGPAGVAGSCSAMVYWNPRILLALWGELQIGNWEAVKSGCDAISALLQFLFALSGERDFPDTSYDRLGGAASGFLKMGLRNRGPYSSATEADVAALQAWYRENWPEMLEL